MRAFVVDLGIVQRITRPFQGAKRRRGAADRESTSHLDEAVSTQPRLWGNSKESPRTIAAGNDEFTPADPGGGPQNFWVPFAANHAAQASSRREVGHRVRVFRHA